jgi:hypothetical protein
MITFWVVEVHLRHYWYLQQTACKESPSRYGRFNYVKKGTVPIKQRDVRVHMHMWELQLSYRSYNNAFLTVARKKDFLHKVMYPVDF